MPRNPTPKGVDSLILCGLGVLIIVVYILTGIFDTCFSASARAMIPATEPPILTISAVLPSDSSLFSCKRME